MPPTEAPGAIDIAARVYSYDLGARGPAFSRSIAVEAPIQLVIGGLPFAVMMATPRDLEDFACGFLLSEQIAQGLADIRGVEVAQVEDGWKIEIALSGERLKAHLARGRAMSGRTGCGLCGIEDLSQLPSPTPLGPADADRSRGGPDGACRTRPSPAPQPDDARRPCRRLGREGRTDRAAARGCRAPQRARQGDRGAGARRDRAGRRLLCHHQPLLVRNGGQGRDFRRDARWCRCRRRRRSLSSWRGAWGSA